MSVMPDQRTDLRDKKNYSAEMFSRIAARYDITNAVLSLGCDRYWRRKMCLTVPKGKALKVLDLASGTADVLLALSKSCPQVVSAVGVDLSETMLAVGQAKVARRGLTSKIKMQLGNAAFTGLAAGAFDVVTMAFGIRNMPDRNRVLKEALRVLCPGGRTLILEFCPPKSTVLNILPRFYVRWILPLVGGLLTGDRASYQYLKDTIANFSGPDDFMAELRTAGFEGVSARKLFPGFVWIFHGGNPAT